jgi:hypothetical protein
MRVRNFPLSLASIAFAWFASLPRCTVGSWSQLEEQFYEYFGKTNEKRPITIESSAKIGLLVGMKERFDSDVSKGTATKAEQYNILSESITSPKTSLVIEKHGKRHKLARLDFLGAKGVVHLSSDYYIIDGDQAPTRNKGGLSACSESTELTLKSAKATPTCSKSARPTSQSARPTTPTAYSESARLISQWARLTTSAACPESAKSASQSAKLTAPASAQVSLTDFQSAKPTFPVLAAADVSLGDLTPLVDWFLEKKSNIMQIKDTDFSNMVNKVENTNILLKF